MSKIDNDPIGSQIKVDVLDFPGLIEPEQKTVVRVEIVHPKKLPKTPLTLDYPLKFPKNRAQIRVWLS